MAETLFEDAEIIYSYTLKDALEDGIIMDLSQVNGIPLYAPVCKGIRYATSSLMGKGYLEGDKINLPNLADLLIQVSQGIRKGLAKGEDRLFEAKVEFPDGHREKVWAVLNEKGSLTIMLPEDY